MGKEVLKLSVDKKGRAIDEPGLLYDPIDELFDLQSASGFHGRSCDRWAIPLKSLRLNERVESDNLDDD